MLKTMLFLTFIFSASAFSAEDSLPDFESELRALETSQMRTEELQMRNADAVTDVITDEVDTGQAAVLKTDPKVETQKTEESPNTVKARRVRAR